MNYPEIAIKTIGQLFEVDNLQIPTYQRPYRWKAEKHVQQLLEDIKREASKKRDKNFRYRMGSIILQRAINDKVEQAQSKRAVVDGQQRLVTLTLIFNALGFPKGLMKQDFPHKDSRNNIKFNYNYIQQYLLSFGKEEKEALATFLLTQCDFVVIQLQELSEAFQMFDSQNARGKSLEPVDLLKAFHLREIENIDLAAKKSIVQKWEKAIDDELLNTVIGEYIFRLRKWQRQEKDYFFTKDEVDEFKGINLYSSIREREMYPYLKRAYLQSMSSNFSATELILNGQRFFEYINHYVSIFVKISVVIKKLDADNKHGEQGIFSYWGSHRIGDQRLKNLYTIVLLYYYDKFGHDNNFDSFARELYRWVFMTRLKQKQIRYQTILNMFLGERASFNPFKLIDAWYTPDIMQMRLQMPTLPKLEQQAKVVNSINYFIKKIEQEW